MIADKTGVDDAIASGVTSADLDRHTRHLDELPNVPPRDWSTLQPISGADLMATDFPPERYAIPGFIPEGLTLIAGGPKLGKTYLALGGALAVACGGRAYGKIAVEQRDVLCCLLEDSRPRLKRRLQQLQAPAEALDHIHFFAVGDKFPRLHEGGVEFLDWYLHQHPSIGLVWLETLQKLRPLSRYGVNAYEQDYAALEPLQMLAAVHRMPTVVAHHTRKGKSDDSLERVSGTNGIAGSVDNIIVLKREGERDGPRYMSANVTGRDIEEARYLFRFDDDGWTLADEAPAVRMSTERQAVIALVRPLDDGLMPIEIADRLGIADATARQRCKAMSDAGQLQRLDTGRYIVPRERVSMREPSRSLTDHAARNGGPVIDADAAIHRE